MLIRIAVQGKVMFRMVTSIRELLFGKKGEIHSVTDTPYDFSQEKEIRSALDAEHPEVKLVKGIDHIFAINGQGFRKAGEVKGEKSGIKMEIYTNRNGIGIYSACGFFYF